ncbi:MAG TPA: GNAT family N-acetyltransferase, partial [Haliangium sp.]|nr:GNAT family N-acetyltransferase [Haliangium sp.]
GAMRNRRRFEAALKSLTWFPALSLPRVLLREIRPADLEDMYRLYTDPRVVQYLNRQPFRSRDEARELLEVIVADHARRSAIHWGLDRTEQPGLVGRCMLYVSAHPGLGVEVGFALAHACWGQGLMTETVRAVLDFGFGVLHLQHIHARVHVANHGAQSLLTRLGFWPLDSEHEAIRARRWSSIDMLGLSRRRWREGRAVDRRS